MRNGSEWLIQPFMVMSPNNALWRPSLLDTPAQLRWPVFEIAARERGYLSRSQDWLKSRTRPFGERRSIGKPCLRLKTEHALRHYLHGARILWDRFIRPTISEIVRHEFLTALRGTRSKNFDAEIPPPVRTGKQFANPMLSRSDSRTDQVLWTASCSKQSVPPPPRLFPCPN